MEFSPIHCLKSFFQMHSSFWFRILLCLMICLDYILIHCKYFRFVKIYPLWLRQRHCRPMISAISNLRKLKSSSKEFDRDEVRPEFFGVRCVRADSDRASVRPRRRGSRRRRKAAPWTWKSGVPVSAASLQRRNGELRAKSRSFRNAEPSIGTGAVVPGVFVQIRWNHEIL